MSEELIHRIAEQIVKQQLHLQWWYYILFFALSIVAAYCGSYASGLAKKRGELSAIADKFDEVQRQLKSNTKVVEDVRAEVLHHDWTLREWKSLRRAKLEELVLCSLAIEEWLDSAHDNSIMFKEVEIGPSPVEKLQVLLRLYFPEMKTEGNALISSTRALYIFILEYGQLLSPHHFGSKKAHLKKDYDKAEEYLKQLESIREKYIADRAQKFIGFWTDKTKFEERAHEILLEIMGIKVSLTEAASGRTREGQQEQTL
ncbi:hypothetical protein [Curvibacter sp. PAE-UM]|uniref:hypothetical protein n=1 Tax=Curvibacter sp. PAE-UM TaxID=1714344 RepID=UPI000708F616|nr:hypothetical protein [Curvibacter sp. PAE-UM]KRH98647.1 hypothetical protein AO057_07195 [Curvibacter sp. PAE-UM]